MLLALASTGGPAPRASSEKKSKGGAGGSHHHGAQRIGRADARQDEIDKTEQGQTEPHP